MVSERPRDATPAALSQPGNRRGVLRALAALPGGGALASLVHDTVDARRQGSNRRNPRKRLRKQCRKQCKHVHHDCLYVCHGQGFDDDICHPRCATAKHACRRGC